MITAHDEVSDEEGLIKLSTAGNHSLGELPRGLVFRLMTAMVASTKTAGLVVVANCATADADSLIAWSKDVSALIEKKSVRPKSAPYMAFADAFLKHSTSEPAKKAANFHLMRLRGIGDLEQALWPPLEAHTSNNKTTDIPTGGKAVKEGGGHIP